MGEIDLSVSLCGIRLRNPVILASGILGVTGASLANVINSGAGAVTMKSLGPEARKGHPCPTVTTWDAGMMNAVGLSNPGVDYGISEIAAYRKLCSQPIIASIFAFNAERFADVAQKVSSAKPDLIEVNISCPNVEREGGTPFAMDAESAAKVTRIVKKATSIPVIVKLSPTAPDIKKIAKAVEDAGADAINMGNTFGPGLLIDIEQKKPVLSNRFGGVSGPAIKPMALKCVWEVYEAVKIPIIGTGGVSTGRDAVEMLMAGASAVGIGTAVYSRGIDVFSKVNDELKEFMANNGYKSIGEMVGLAHK